MIAINTLFVIVATTLVFFMVCGLALFYSGLVPAKNALNTIKMNFFTMAILILIWTFIGYSLSFSGSNPFIGNFNYVFLDGLFDKYHPGNGVAMLVFASFEMMFAVIAAALISGAIVERMKFKAFICFVILWSIFFYSTVVHWVWSSSGWLANWGVFDFAGGLAIHIGAGFSALILAIMLKPRKFLQESTSHNIPFVILGVSILWFGYFGFNSGSALEVNKIAFVAFINTAIAPATAIITWVIIDNIRSKKSSAVNVAVAAVVGLVSITPSAGYVRMHSAFFISLITTCICYFAFNYINTIKNRVDDSLNVFVCHGLSGFIGVILVGVFAETSINPSIPNGLIKGQWDLLFKQTMAALIVVIFATLMTFIIISIIKLFMAIRVTEEEEKIGLDITQHGEIAYPELKPNTYLKRQLSKEIAKSKLKHATKKRFRRLNT